MIEVQQTILHDPDNGQFGDCYRACLASILELPIEGIPPPPPSHDKDAWWGVYMPWLRSRGLLPITIPVNDQMDGKRWRELFEWWGADVYHIISGDSPRFPGTRHAIVGMNGKPVWDPHPTGLGLNSVEDFEFLIQIPGGRR